MKVKVLISILYITFLVVLNRAVAKEDKFITIATVSSLGQCYAGAPYYDGTNTCAIKVVSRKGIEFWRVRNGVTDGQTVYKHCWEKNESPVCFPEAGIYIQRGWKGAPIQ